jgi:hypothetical protein
MYAKGDIFAFRTGRTVLNDTLSGAKTPNRMDFLKDLWLFMKERKKFWLAPVIIVLLVLGLLIVFGGSSAVAPFIYTLF